MAGSPPARTWPQLRLAGLGLLRGAPALFPTLLIVGLLTCVLVPLPTVLVDLLLSLSLAGSVLLLVASLRVEKVSQLRGFPTLLLLLTLFRIALNVSTTRLILTQADAGRVIDAFANFVIRGDLIVGAVMFGIITIVQYLVIAKGAERVAEVAARFALDALPGQQQAIEADRRDGALSAREAARRRAELVDRSHFHGAMDGAIRYVKGDALAGLVIIVVNLGGGLAVGIGRLGMSLPESLEVYGSLTIGDGLVAQIPALLLSLAASILVSRVDSDAPSRPWLEGPMLLVPALFLGLLAVVPGMPAVAFGTTALALVAAALVLVMRTPEALVAERRLELVVPNAVLTSSRRTEGDLAGLRLRCADATGLDLPPVVVVHERGRETIDLRAEGRTVARVRPGAATDDGALVAAYRAILRAAPQLLELDTIDESIERLRATHPALVREATQRMRPADILVLARGFLRERLPMPPVAAFLSVVATDPRFGRPEERPRFLELAREQLVDHWLRDQLDAMRKLADVRWVRPTPDFEEALLAVTYRDGDDSTWMATPAERETFRSALFEANEDTPTIVLTRPRGRAAFAALLLDRSPHVPVISTAELEALGEPRPEAVWVHAPRT